jgi:excisionase family DNA binding protein
MGEEPDNSMKLLPLIQRILDDLEDIRSLLCGQRKDYLTTHEVASATGRSEYTVRRWISEGRLEAIRVSGTGPRGRLLVPRGEMQKLVNQGLGAQLSAAEID